MDALLWRLPLREKLHVGTWAAATEEAVQSTSPLAREQHQRFVRIFCVSAQILLVRDVFCLVR